MKKPQINDDKKKKWDNFWYYYKYHVLAGVFVLVCIIIFGLICVKIFMLANSYVFNQLIKI